MTIKTTNKPVHPRADHVQVMFCEDWDRCGRPHVVLFDDQNQIIADFVLPDPHEDGGGFLNDLNKANIRSLLVRANQGKFIP